MTDLAATVFEVSGNFALAQIVGRRFPGLLIQGDSLSNIQVSVRELEAALLSGERESSEYALRDMMDTIDAMVDAYERMMGNAGLALPYHREP
jgi:hypothetical protein